MTMRLYCIRHGQSIYNAEGRIQGQVDIPLSELGIAQGDAAGSALTDLPIDVVFSSPLKRALTTAERIAQSRDLPLRTDPRLMEINVGVFQERTSDEVAKLYPEELARWKSEDLDFVVPGGESRRMMVDRGRAAIIDMAREGFEQVAMVSHGRFLIGTLKEMLGMAPTDSPNSLQNGSISVIDVEPCGKTTLVELNRTEHLADIGLSGSGDM